MKQDEIIDWLLHGDVSIQYQIWRDLLGKDRKELQSTIADSGWGAMYLSLRHDNGYWGRGFYQPKWTSSHYSLLDLRNLCIAPENPMIRESIHIVAEQEKGPDGGINPSRAIGQSDVCINGMFLNYASYFGLEIKFLLSIVDYILTQRMEDGGFNCRKNRSGARHSSLHSTLSLTEGIAEYAKNGYQYRLAELQEAKKTSEEFILQHQLFISDRTGEIIHDNFLRLSYPGRWRYDILRALDYFQYTKAPFDERMQPAIEILFKKRRKDKKWLLQANHPGQRHFDMEEVGKPSRWNTLRALRVLKHFKLN